ncbi:MAG: hypothetical protein BWY04_00531 [candidate division CPR1 bacterium ADurb.Bin160]|uniref:Uncharacterized protein n=1 Tax=candidate division CPR1 bacterium ADurb.Bin160 TaxID=1852826 RepID=A0A1V5ZPA5_9BACT|nr:MAG: hypothetical protein BWY04_00531 [candidate division CPR1 bacterium ADurb.Bin160]
MDSDHLSDNYSNMINSNIYKKHKTGIIFEKKIIFLYSCLVNILARKFVDI